MIDKLIYKEDILSFLSQLCELLLGFLFISTSPGQSGIGMKPCSAVVPRAIVEKLISANEESTEKNLDNERKRKIRSNAAAEFLSNHSIKKMFNDSKHLSLDRTVARFFYYEGIPFLKSSSVYFKDVLSTAAGVPVRVPTRKRLSGQLLDDEYSRVKKLMKTTLPPTATLVSDGWKNFASSSLVNYVLSTPEASFFHSSDDLTGVRKTGEKLSEMLLKKIDELSSERIKVRSVITDSGSDVRKGRDLVEESRPEIVTGACLPHTLDLLVEDVAKIKSVADTLAKAERAASKL